MRGAFLIVVLLGLLVSGILVAKRLKTVPQAAHHADLRDINGKPVADLKHLPQALENNIKGLNAKTDASLKAQED